ncbi:hypothetical protein ANN_18019 [Periplaneta americana]|uniref:Uncharacterized protein n=1 Tax=Periplaneta americana TaxID=6978 RepID=A0ABQ8SMK1_PERAM|nr:hypothetical protein ANN_18019 [Periplaneta americana]
MAGLCEGGNEPSGSLKAICKRKGKKSRRSTVDVERKQKQKYCRCMGRKGMGKEQRKKYCRAEEGSEVAEEVL